MKKPGGEAVVHAHQLSWHWVVGIPERCLSRVSPLGNITPFVSGRRCGRVGAFPDSMLITDFQDSEREQEFRRPFKISLVITSLIPMATRTNALRHGALQRGHPLYRPHPVGLLMKVNHCHH
jgi:hypothetical protein